jgi:hypothetical protein
MRVVLQTNAVVLRAADAAGNVHNLKGVCHAAKRTDINMGEKLL